jgi:hypothetical protein
MSEMILKFNLPDEQQEANLAYNGWKYSLIIDQLYEHIRQKLKYDESLTEEQDKIYEEIRDVIYDMSHEYEVRIL